MSTFFMAHTLTEADQTERPGLSGEAAHDDVCQWLGFHSGPTLTDDIPALDGMYLHLAGILRAELPEFACATPGAAFVVEGWAGESEATRQLYAPGTGLLPQAMRATRVGSVDHRDLTLVAALAADLDRLQQHGLDPARPETFAGVVARAQYRPAAAALVPRIVDQIRGAAGLIGHLSFRQNGTAAVVTFECWADAQLCDRATRELADGAAGGPARTVPADLLSIMLPAAGAHYVAPVS